MSRKSEDSRNGAGELALVIMAGGVGTRLYPASSPSRPKQFVRWPGSNSSGDPPGEDLRHRRSLIQETYALLSPLAPAERIFVVAPVEFAGCVSEQLPELPNENLILEPVRRGSAGACALATAHISRSLGSEATVAIIPSDAWVEQPDVYRDALAAAARVADSREGIVVVGIRPSRPATYYGYICPGDLVEPGVHRVRMFIEKPDAVRAEALVRDGCLWNAGIFVWRSDLAQKAFRELLPEHGRLFDEDVSPGLRRELFGSLRSVSVDIGIAEKAANIFCVSGHFGWDDLGAWDAFGRVFPADPLGNVCLGEARFVDSQRCVVVADEGKVVTLGVSDLVVVRFGDTILICPRNRSQDVGKLLEER